MIHTSYTYIYIYIYILNIDVAYCLLPARVAISCLVAVDATRVSGMSLHDEHPNRNGPLLQPPPPWGLSGLDLRYEISHLIHNVSYLIYNVR